MGLTDFFFFVANDLFRPVNWLKYFDLFKGKNGFDQKCSLQIDNLDIFPDQRGRGGDPELFLYFVSLLL